MGGSKAGGKEGLTGWAGRVKFKVGLPPAGLVNTFGCHRRRYRQAYFSADTFYYGSLTTSMALVVVTEEVGS